MRRFVMVRIRLPRYTDECRDDAGGGWKADGVCDWPDDVPCDFGSPTLEDRHPDVHHVVTRFTLTSEQQTGMVYEVDVDGARSRRWCASGWPPTRRSGGGGCPGKAPAGRRRPYPGNAGCAAAKKRHV